MAGNPKAFHSNGNLTREGIENFDQPSKPCFCGRAVVFLLDPRPDLRVLHGHAGIADQSING